MSQLHQQAQQDCENLGIATVYRTLKLLQESGDIRTIWFTDGEPRYEPADARRSYFVCNSCHDVEHLDESALQMAQSTRLPSGYTFDHHELTVFGTCPRCNGASAGAGRDADGPVRRMGATG